MSAVIERFLICDGCAESFGVDARSRLVEEHRAHARQEGWTYVSGKDYCPACRPEARKIIDPPVPEGIFNADVYDKTNTTI